MITKEGHLIKKDKNGRIYTDYSRLHIRHQVEHRQEMINMIEVVSDILEETLFNQKRKA